MDPLTMFNTILCATDGAENGKRALEVARRLIEQHGTTLRVVHVAVELPGGCDLHDDEARRIALVKAQVAAMRRHGVDASLHVIRGGAIADLARIIADTAEAVDADMIVVGTRGASPLAGVLRRGLTGRLLHVTGRPVLAVPPGEPAEREPMTVATASGLA